MPARPVAQLLGEVEVKAPRTLVLEPGAYPPALVLANFRDKDVDTLLDLMWQAQVTIPAQGGGHPRKPQLDVCRPAGAFAGGAHRL